MTKEENIIRRFVERKRRIPCLWTRRQHNFRAVVDPIGRLQDFRGVHKLDLTISCLCGMSCVLPVATITRNIAIRRRDCGICYGEFSNKYSKKFHSRRDDAAVFPEWPKKRGFINYRVV